MALSFSAGSLSVVANSKPSLISSGFVPRKFAFPSGSPKPSPPSSLVVKAENNPESSHFGHSHKSKPALIDSPPYVRTPYGHAVTENEIIMSFDMPGVEAFELEVIIYGDELSIKFKGPRERVDGLGRTITGFYDTRIQLPHNCFREKSIAEFKNGILYVKMPRTNYDRDIPIKIPVNNII